MMKFRFLLLVLIVFVYSASSAQKAKDYAIQLEASIAPSSAEVTLSWIAIPGATEYKVSKRNTQFNTWVVVGTTKDTFYVITDAEVSKPTYYQVETIDGVKAFGNIYTGHKVSPIHHRGTLVLVVDSLFIDSCQTEILTLIEDIIGDGWSLERININRNATDVELKGKIKELYNAIPDVKAVLLLGHVAVPYSGNIYPDGHTNHQGAWPADVFYADMDGNWSDNYVNVTSASRTENQNTPGDGKWDQSILPSKAELQVSRIDFFNMLLFAESEVTLMKRYLAKLHAYKSGSLQIVKQGIIKDNFGGFSGEAFASTAWRGFAPLLGRDQVLEKEFISALNETPYQWAYGCGPGSYTSCSGVAKTADFVKNAQKGIFTILFGSYFGDWDNANNILRAPLCSPEPSLISFWAGRPHWFIQVMALGDNIGKAFLNTVNNNSPVVFQPPGYLPGGVHVALLGDLTLRTDYIQPAENIKINTEKGQGATIQWSPSPDKDVLGYYIYRSEEYGRGYERISDLVTDISYQDKNGDDGLKYYMVRPCKLENNPSGSYYNLGLGIVDSATVSFPESTLNNDVPDFEGKIFCSPNPTSDFVNIYLNIDQIINMPEFYRIRDLNGKIIKDRVRLLEMEQHVIREDLSSYPAGMYLIEFYQHGRIVAVNKLIKM